VKLSAEVCDLSESMREEMNKGASQIITLLGEALEKGRQEGSLTFDGDAFTLSQVLYSLWLGANLQAKITRSAMPLESALAHAKQIIAAPGV
jgi:TetR/AcrR family transcriptional repressor of nem operon